MKVKCDIYKMSSDNLFIRFSDKIDLRLNQFIKTVYNNILNKNIIGFIDGYFAYSSMLVHFDMGKTNFNKFKKEINTIINETKMVENFESNIIEIPLEYDYSQNSDLQFASDYLKLSKDEIVSIHLNQIYHVYAIGFLPGFCYLGGLDKRIALPRHDSPKLHIEKGSVGIANNQTGIYPLDSPGGWQIIGKTRVKMFDIESNNPFIVLPGDKIKFIREK